MASKYIDALKQALDHSMEEEAECAEQIQAAEGQIAELEGRIEECNSRLKTVAADKDKIIEIMQRYSSADAVKAAGAQESKPAATKPSAPAKAEGAAAAAKAESKPADKSKPRVEAPPAKGQPAAKAEEKPAEEEDETVKNINDALRGLFR